MSPTIRDLPAVRALAEKQARAYAAAWADAKNLDWLAWDRLDTLTQERRVAAHLALLTDITLPASALALAGALAEHCFSADVSAAGTVPFTHPAFWLGGSDDDATELWVAADGVSYRFDLDGFKGWNDTSALLTIALHVLTPDPA